METENFPGRKRGELEGMINAVIPYAIAKIKKDFSMPINGKRMNAPTNEPTNAPTVFERVNMPDANVSDRTSSLIEWPINVNRTPETKETGNIRKEAKIIND